MSLPFPTFSASIVVLACLAPHAASAACDIAPVTFSGSHAEVEGSMTVNAGSSCRFGVNGIPGALSEVRISQAPRVGRAGVENLRPFYVAKAGYKGPDEFAYVYIGTDQYGGPMNVVVRRKVTVIP